MITDEYKTLIKAEFISCTQRTIERTNTRLRNPESGGTLKPFHTRLLTREAIIWSQFERSFSTSFGQSLIEKISKYVALSCGAEEASGQKETDVSLYSSQYSAIDAHISAIRDRRTGLRGCWNTDIRDLMKVQPAGDIRTERVISDLWFLRNNIEYFVSIKTVKPNIDQSAQAKKDLLMLKLNNNACKVYFGLYYNPYGNQRDEYRPQASSKIFNFSIDDVVLIGKEYWDTIGETDVYEQLLEIVDSAQDESMDMIENFATQHSISVVKDQ